MPVEMGVVEALGEYARERFEFADRLICEARANARHLISTIGVVVGFELAIVGSLVAPDVDASPARIYVHTLLLILFVTISAQLAILWNALGIGFSQERVLGPENPKVLAKQLETRDTLEAKRIVAAYYAKAAVNFNELAASLSMRVRKVAYEFAATLILTALLVGLYATRPLLKSGEGYEGCSHEQETTRTRTSDERTSQSILRE